MLTLRLFFTLGYLFDGEKTFHFFFQQKSSLRSFVKKSLKVFSYLKTSTFWSFWKKFRNECFLKKKKSRNASDNVEKKFSQNSWNPFLISIWHARTPPFTFKRKITIIFDDSIWPIHFGQIKSFKNKAPVSS